MHQHTLLARFLVASLVAASQLAVSGWAIAAAPKPFRAEYSALRNGEKLGVATIGFSARPGGRFELLTATRGSEGLAAVAGVSIEERSVLAWAGNRPDPEGPTTATICPAGIVSDSASRMVSDASPDGTTLDTASSSITLNPSATW